MGPPGHPGALASAWSRLSARNRQACSSAAGPRNRSGFHQNDGHAVVQQPHRMHSYKSVKLVAIRGRLQALDLRFRIVVDEPGFDRPVLGDRTGSSPRSGHGSPAAPATAAARSAACSSMIGSDAGQPVAAVDVHGIRAAHALAAGTAEAETVVLLLEQQQRVEQHHRAAVVRAARSPACAASRRFPGCSGRWRSACPYLVVQSFRLSA